MRIVSLEIVGYFIAIMRQEPEINMERKTTYEGKGD